MRTDATIRRIKTKAPHITCGEWVIEPGDMIEYVTTYTDGSSDTMTARVIGRVTAPGLSEPHVCVIAIQTAGRAVMERWVRVDAITACYRCSERTRAMLAFLTSPEFNATTPDTLRAWSASGYATPEDMRTRRLRDDLSEVSA